MNDIEKLLGETIVEAKIQKHYSRCDSENQLVLGMKSGKIFHITGGYDGYTGKSCDEYRECIDIELLEPKS